MSRGSKKTNDYRKFKDERSLEIEDENIIGKSEYSYEEGLATEASSEGSHAEGIMTIAAERGSHAEGRETEANGYVSHGEGYMNIANGDYSHAEGKGTVTTGDSSHCEGWNTKAVGDDSHAEGSMTISNGISSHAEGSCTEANGDFSHSEGWLTKANSMYSHVEGVKCYANGCGAHAEGHRTIANGDYSHAAGYETIAQNDYQTVIGKYNKPSNNDKNGLQNDDAFIIGNGDLNNASNAFRVTFEGNVYAGEKASYYSGGSNYAEMFEWIDKNINNYDRTGYFVTLEEDKIRIVNNRDEYILGVISTTPSVVGDAYGNQFSKMYLEDSWGIVGMLGKILVKDDGTCLVNGYCMPNNNGVATASQYGYRVLKRIAANQILILFR